MSISIQELKNLRPVTKEDDERLRKEVKKECSREYNAQYYKENREKLLKRQKQYNKENREILLEQHKQYHKEHREERLKFSSQYYRSNRERVIEKTIQYRKDHPEINARRRKLGFNPINEHFEGGEWHHINENDVMCIPVELHRSIKHNLKTSKNMEEINDLAMEFMLAELGEC